MNPDDDGTFEYSPAYPPFCFKNSLYSIKDKEEVKAGIRDYIQDSCKFGLKDENAVLPCGLTSGEAAFHHMRETNQQRRKTPMLYMETDEIITFLKLEVKNVFFSTMTNMDTIINKHLLSEIFHTRQYRKKLFNALKNMLKETKIKIKSKDQNDQINSILSKTEIFLQNVQQNGHTSPSPTDNS